MPHALDEQVFMHPTSHMARAAPDLVVYMQIVRTEKRPYMTGAEPGCLDFMECNTLKSAAWPQLPPT
jgi:hypothetical protein